MRLAAKKYRITIYEKTSSMGGSLRHILPEDFFMEDINRQFKYESYTLHTDTEITDIDQITSRGFDAVYIATGKNGSDLGMFSSTGTAGDTYCRLIDETSAACHSATAVYAGGELLGRDVVHAAAEGLIIAREIEGFLKTGIARYPEAA